MDRSSTGALGFPAPDSRWAQVDHVAAALPGDNCTPTSTVRAITADALCEQYAGRVFKFALLISEDSISAEDLAQDALERAIKGLRTVDPSRGPMEGWLWRIVVNAGRDAGKIERRQRLVVKLLVDRWLHDEAVCDVGELRRQEVLEAVRTLSPRNRTVIALRFSSDLTYREVGKLLGISEAAALMATKRALAILRVRLSQEVQRR